jgi:hypothetical protein
MNRRLFAAVAALLAAAFLPAQDSCPMQEARTVPQTIAYGPNVACAGLSYSIPGLQITTATGCPLFATITPDHEVADPSRKRTYVVSVGMSAGKLIFFGCRTSYLIFIPIGSSCEYLNDVNFGAFPRLTTKACADERAE